MLTPDVHVRAPDSSGLGLRTFDLEPEDHRWEEFVARHPQALPYHHPSWLRVLQEAFGYRNAALGCMDDEGRLCGILPLLEKKSLLAGLHLSSLPHTPVAGPLAAGADSLRALLSAAAARVDQSAARWLQLKVVGPSLDGLADRFSRLEWDATYVLELPDDTKNLRFGNSRNHSRISWAVRKAARLGVTVRPASSLADVRRWYRLYLETMRAHATPPRPFRLFEVMWNILAPLDRLHLLLAERQTGGQPQIIAGSLFLMHGQTVIYAFNGRDRRQLQFRPNDAIHWTAITEACTSGFRRYDFGEVAEGHESLAVFKEKWGARPVALYRYDYPQQREIERGILASDFLRRTQERAWRLLPLSATAGMGRWIYGHL
jgi:CelD/BcsL family acetyltransferase involved in cellulose biosynthesis